MENKNREIEGKNIREEIKQQVSVNYDVSIDEGNMRVNLPRALELHESITGRNSRPRNNIQINRQVQALCYCCCPIF
jgi:hypothetical protein